MTILGPCKRQTFLAEAPFDGNVIDLYNQIFDNILYKNRTVMFVGLLNDQVTIITKSYKIDWNDLGNAIGGGLGLYLGLSLLSVLTFVKSFIEAKV